MSTKPPPIPLKYKVADDAQQPAQPRRMPVPPAKKTTKVSHWESIFRLGIALVILVSIAVAYWSFSYYLAPLQQEARATLTRVTAMSSRLDEMERRWTPAQVAETRARYGEAYAQLFTSRPELETWLTQVQAPASWLALDVKVVFGQATPQPELTKAVSVIPVSLALEVKPQPFEAKLTPYERVLGFSQLLAGHGKRADLGELNVTGGAGSIRRADMTFNLWAGDVAAEAETGSTNTVVQAAK